jgi:hypothetical protein
MMVCVCAATGFAVVGPRALAAKSPGTAAVLPAPASLERVMDRATGLEVRVERRSDAVTIETGNGRVSIAKRMTLGRSETTIASGAEAVGIVVEQGDVRVRRQGRTVSFAALDAAALPLEQAALRTSRPIVEARALLARMNLTGDTPTAQALGLTQALLGLIVGDASVVAAYRNAAAARARAPRLEPAGFQVGPLACWDIYNRDAIKIWDDFIACKKDLNWYDFLGAYSCDAIYILQAEMAMDWLYMCEGSSGLKSIK